MLALILVFAAALYVIGLRADRVHATRTHHQFAAGRGSNGKGAGARNTRPTYVRRTGGMPAPGLEYTAGPGLTTLAVVRHEQTRPTITQDRAYWKHVAYLRGRRIRELKHVLLARTSVTEAINLAATAYGVSASLMWSIARCESGLNPRAFNPSSSSGLFQLLYPSTWRTTPYARFDVFSPYANALAGAYMLAHGRRSEWVC